MCFICILPYSITWVEWGYVQVDLIFLNDFV